MASPDHSVPEAIEALARDPSPANASALSEAVTRCADARPFLAAIAGLLHDESIRDAVRSLILQVLQQWVGDEETIAAILADIERQNPNRPEVSSFVDIARQANRSLMSEAYRKMIRNLTRSYEDDGTIPRCPACKSDKVTRGAGIFEFTEMKCNACGKVQLADDYQLEAWYPE